MMERTKAESRRLYFDVTGKMERFKKHLADRGFKVTEPPTPADGNCLFHALRTILELHDETAADVRFIVLQFIKENILWAKVNDTWFKQA